METLKSILETVDTPAGRAFDYFIQVLIVISLCSFSIETLPALSSSTLLILHWIEVVTVAIFTAEYLLRIIVSDNKIKFMVSPFGLIDLAAILPFYLTTGLDLRSLRAMRLLRLFRTLKLIRYSNAIQTFHKALRLAKEELVLFLSLSLLLLFFSAVGIYYFENEAQPEVFASIFHSLWWAVATLTTVGYGDVFPITAGGRVFTFLILMIGLGIVAVPTAVLASALTRAREGTGAKRTDG